MDESEFHERVTDSGPVEEPEPITEATLETLGEALSSGQAEDVAAHLPDEYASTLTEAGERPGTDEGGTGGDGAGETHRVSESERQSRESVTLSRMEFVERVRDRVADYAGGAPDDPDELQPQVAAVTEALQESIPREEQRGLRSQLPDDVESLFTDGESGR